jgi:hypothetical protein
MPPSSGYGINVVERRQPLTDVARTICGLNACPDRLGAGYLTRHSDAEARARRLARQIEKLGFHVTTNTRPLTQQLPHTAATPGG